MKQFTSILSLLALGLALAGSAQANTINTKGYFAPLEEVQREERKVGAFTNIEVSNALELRLRSGNVNTVAVECKTSILPRITTVVKGNTLTIATDGMGWFRNSGKIIVYVTVKQLESLEASGASKVIGENEIKGKNLRLESSGASTINMNLDYTTILSEISGASSVKLKGKAGNISLDGSGASNFTAIDLEANSVKVDLSGASSASVYAKKSLDAEASGASSIKYKGDANVNSDITGASSIKKIGILNE